MLSLTLLKACTSGTKITKWAPWRKHSVSTIAGYYSSWSERSDDVLDMLSVLKPKQEGPLFCALFLRGSGISQTYTNTLIKEHTEDSVTLCAQYQYSTHKSINICFHDSYHSGPKKGFSTNLTSKQKVHAPELWELLACTNIEIRDKHWVRWGVFEWQKCVGERIGTLTCQILPLRECECNRFLHNEMQFPRHLFSYFSSCFESQFQRSLWIRSVFYY